MSVMLNKVNNNTHVKELTWTVQCPWFWIEGIRESQPSSLLRAKRYESRRNHPDAHTHTHTAGKVCSRAKSPYKNQHPQRCWGKSRNPAPGHGARLFSMCKKATVFFFLSSRLFLSPSSRPYFSRLPWLCGSVKCSTWARVSWTWQVSVSHTSTYAQYPNWCVRLSFNVHGHIRSCQAVQIFHFSSRKKKTYDSVLFA